MLLAIDAGNTNVVFAVHDGAEWRGRWRIATRPDRTSDEYAVWLLALLQHCGLKVTEIDRCVIGTVVPAALYNLRRLSREWFHVEPLIARESGFSVTEAMTAPETVTGIDRVQPTIFTMQVALAAAMRAYGVQPGAVIGHSLGEVAASVVAGALSLEDGVRVICRRSRLMSRIAGSGAMASVELPATQVLSELAGRGTTDVALAVVASPQSTVIGGATETVRKLVAAWEQRPPGPAPRWRAAWPAQRTARPAPTSNARRSAPPSAPASCGSGSRPRNPPR